MLKVHRGRFRMKKVYEKPVLVKKGRLSETAAQAISGGGEVNPPPPPPPAG